MSSRNQFEPVSLFILLIILFILQMTVGNQLLPLPPLASSLLFAGVIFLVLGRLLYQFMQQQQLFAAYVGKDIAQSVLTGHQDGQFVEATVLFADIRDFTGLSEQTALPMLLEELNSYYDEMQQAIEAEGGVINKFGGDSLLALFGTPVAHDDHAEKGLRAAERMIAHLARLNAQRQANGRLPIKIGIGISSGQMITGEVGSHRRREYTVLGDCVNVAKRLSDLNKQYVLQSIFFSEQTWLALPKGDKWPILPLGDISVKGRSGQINAFALQGNSISAQPPTVTPQAARSPLPPQTILQFGKQLSRHLR